MEHTATPRAREPSPGRHLLVGSTGLWLERAAEQVELRASCLGAPLPHSLHSASQGRCVPWWGHSAALLTLPTLPTNIAAPAPVLTGLVLPLACVFIYLACISFS